MSLPSALNPKRIDLKTAIAALLPLLHNFGELPQYFTSSVSVWQEFLPRRNTSSLRVKSASLQHLTKA
ncbi:MAG TPA: hypothetical protein IGS53_12010 [Leptolyngbyaceae cyanobacterium M33_DOE_097]|uniref:Uncharacterized protein n=1 Tax=Oscillatoriales cyanobacterium SpSt-418 TaxID=2282169 RepID=A0A7C3PF45_9CYAN|nr:hypothetical protein [Leptolyngbyaceae cyanobacterium M33_DOE_097]